MKLSIVVPSYRQARYLPHALASLVNQCGVARDELEILVIDGGSADGSVECIRAVEDRIDYWVSEPDRGQTHALLKGFDRSTGDILGWLCADDTLEPGAVRHVLDHFRDAPKSQFIYGDAQWIDENGRVIRPKKEIPFNWFIWMYDHNYIPQPSAFWRRSLYEEAGGLDESMDLAMDGDLWARFAQRARPVHLRRTLSRIRVHSQQKTQRFHLDSRREQQCVRRSLGAGSDSGFQFAWRRLLAKSWRAGWKLASGCYW
jgi:glycosyltransferase involved in cell wall biosynthesis